MTGPIIIPMPIPMGRGGSFPPLSSVEGIALAVSLGCVYLALLGMTWVMATDSSLGRQSVVEKLIGWMLFAAVASPAVITAVWWLL